MIAEITPTSAAFIQQIKRQAKTIETEIAEIDKIAARRKQLFNNCISQFQNYTERENELMDRNLKHCQPRNQWYKDQVNKSWGIAIANRQLILRSVARTNVLKKDTDQWLERINEGQLPQQLEEQFVRPEENEDLEGSKLIDKYNQILLEYGHKI